MIAIYKKFTPALIAIFILFGLKTDLKAQRLDISGVGSYVRSGNFVTLGIDRIDHYINPFYDWSGTLYLQLWTCLTPYNGLQTSLGYKVAEATLGSLSAGYYVSNVSETVPFFAPPNGTYYMVMVLAESDGYQPLTMDWFNFSKTETFGYIPPPPTPKITSNLSTVSLKLGKLMTRYTVTTNFGAKSFSAKGLPAGLQLNATTGIVSGKPSKKGTYTVTFTAAKKQGSKVIQSKTAKKVFKVN
jgi:hypothetical protein